MLELMTYVLMIRSLDDPSWVVRRDAEHALVVKMSADPVNREYLLDATTSPEARWRASRVRDRYRDVKLVSLPHDYDSAEWWNLYTRVTGVKKDETGWFFAVMPTPDDENAMRELWVGDRFREGYSRIQVVEMVKELTHETGP